MLGVHRIREEREMKHQKCCSVSHHYDSTMEGRFIVQRTVQGKTLPCLKNQKDFPEEAET